MTRTKLTKNQQDLDTAVHDCWSRVMALRHSNELAKNNPAWLAVKSAELAMLSARSAIELQRKKRKVSR